MTDENGLSFWDHLDVLRGVLMRIILLTLLLSAVAFCFKDLLFDIVFAPKEADFITYRYLFGLSAVFGGENVDFNVKLINTGLAQQFMTHMKTALCAGVLLASPYAIYLLFRFISPALYSNEKKYAAIVSFGGYIMFMLGVAVSYFLIFPLTFRFLGTYEVSAEVENMISLESYMGTLIMMCLMMGTVFELPVACWLCGKMGIVSSAFMKKYRKQALVAILVVAAVITPTADAFTMLVVALPIYLLYESGILIVKSTERKAALAAA